MCHLPARYSTMSNPKCEPTRSGLEKFIFYQTTSCLYIIGCDKHQKEYRVLKLSRSNVNFSARLPELVTEDLCTYSRVELKDMLEMIHEGNRTQGGLTKVATGYGIIGFVSFLDCYHIYLVSQRRKVGQVGGNTIYGIKATEIIALKADVGSFKNESVIRCLVSGVSRHLNPTQREIAEQRYLGLFQFIDLTKDFYFSYTYDLSRTLQHSMTVSSPVADSCTNLKPNAMYSWNEHMTYELSLAIGWASASTWTLCLIHGAFVERKCSSFGRITNLILVARRSRHFAGTRYLKRGVSDSGKVANDVEIEQIVHEEGAGKGIFSSHVQMRGSIPIFWTQETSVTMPKPPIILNRVDPDYAASRAHFADLFERYSVPVVVLDLTKQVERRERELIVSQEFRRAIAFVNQSSPDDEVLSKWRLQTSLSHSGSTELDLDAPTTRNERENDARETAFPLGSQQASAKIRYSALDFSQVSKQRQLSVVDALDGLAKWAVHETRFFCSQPLASWPADNFASPHAAFQHAMSQQLTSRANKLSLMYHVQQRGVLRTNCIDCLDRTNVAQFTVGAHALRLVLAITGIRAFGARVPPGAESGDPIILVLMELYSLVGDMISLQYGGSEAHKKMASAQPSPPLSATVGAAQLNDLGATKHKELLTSIRRYYSNAFTDRLKQDAINVFLGVYSPAACHVNHLPLWELESDYYLHNFHVQTGTMLSMRARRESWLSSSDEDEVGYKLRSVPLIDDDGNSAALQPLCACQCHAGRRTRVVQRCRRQAKALSEWWISALKSFEFRNEFIPFPSRSDARVPVVGTYFSRVHRPEKLTHFDNVLSRDFLVPSHLARDMAPCRGGRGCHRQTIGRFHLRVGGQDECLSCVGTQSSSVCITPKVAKVLSLALSKTRTRNQFQSRCHAQHVVSTSGDIENRGDSVGAFSDRTMVVVGQGLWRSPQWFHSQNNVCSEFNIAEQSASCTGASARTEQHAVVSRAHWRNSYNLLENKLNAMPYSHGFVLASNKESSTSHPLVPWSCSSDSLHLTHDVDTKEVESIPNHWLFDSSFVGSFDYTQPVARGDAEYGEYARVAHDWALLGLNEEHKKFSSLRSSSLFEFESALAERNLVAADVRAIHAISSAAGVATVLQSGPYRGLRHDTIARDVVAVVCFQLDAAGAECSESSARVPCAEGNLHTRTTVAQIDALLEASGQCQQGLVAQQLPDGIIGMAECFIDQMAKHLFVRARAQRNFENLLDPMLLSSAHSTYADLKSIKLYCSFFLVENRLNDRCFMQILGWKPMFYADHLKDSVNGFAPRELVLPTDVELCCSIGNSNSEHVCARIRDLACTSSDGSDISTHFFPLATDLYACLSNKYMLFNEVAARSLLVLGFVAELNSRSECSKT